MASIHPTGSPARPLALITGASSGIGMHLAREAAAAGYDLLLGADTPFDETRALLEGLPVEVRTVETDLAMLEGVDELYEALDGRVPEVLVANAGHGLGRGFLDQDFDEILDVIDTNITGTIYLIQRVARDMRDRGTGGRILVTGSIAGFMPGSFQAVYNGTKAFIDNFTLALRNELEDTGITVTCLMPGVTDTEFFERADLMDTKVGTQQNKMDPAEVARIGWKAMEDGEGDVVAGLKNKLQVGMAKLSPEMAAEQHRRMAEPGTAQN
jgi:short-subunit dehydrogenase